MSHINSEQRVLRRQRDAQYRQKLWEKLSLEQRIAVLDERLGVGVGAVKQRARLQQQIEAAKTKPQKSKKLQK